MDSPLDITKNLETVRAPPLKYAMPDHNLSTDRLHLNRLHERDAADLFRTVGDPAVMEHWWPGPDQSLAHTQKRIQQINTHWSDHGFGDWGVWESATNRLIGFCGLHYIPNMVEANIGYAFEKSRWRKGYGYEAVLSVLNVGFTYLDLPEIVAVIVPTNRASIGLSAKCGLKLWKSFKWEDRDRVAYRIEKQDYARPP